MPYPEEMVRPMREDLTRRGVEELTTADAVDAFFAKRDGPAMLVFNSVCGCAAGNARPAVKLSLEHPMCPQRVASVFAGQDVEAASQARSYMPDLPPSSPSVVILNDGELVDYLPRHRIEMRDPQNIATELTRTFESLGTTKEPSH